MSNFIDLLDLPCLDLHTELQSLISNNVIHFNKNTTQICLNTVEGKENDYEFGRGSLFYDWENKTIDANGQVHVPEREIKYKETDFTILCNQFLNTKFQTVYDALANKYMLGRVRIMNLKPKTCLSWHVDEHPRVHYPIKTQKGCFMVIGSEVKHLEKDTWYFTNTLLEHTVFNGSNEDRYHLVATIIGEK